MSTSRSTHSTTFKSKVSFLIEQYEKLDIDDRTIFVEAILDIEKKSLNNMLEKLKKLDLKEIE